MAHVTTGPRGARAGGRFGVRSGSALAADGASHDAARISSPKNNANIMILLAKYDRV